MLTELIRTIESLRERIKEHRTYFDAGAPETRTRVSLIDPMLSALGWDVGDPGLVEIEPVVANGRADYALLSGIGEPLLLLEAKRLSEDTKPHYGQLVSYVVGENLTRRVNIPILRDHKWEPLAGLRRVHTKLRCECFRRAWQR